MKKTLLMMAIFTGLFFGGTPLLSSGITIKKSYQNSFFKYLVKAQDNLQTQQIVKSESFGGEWERVARDGFDDLNNDYAWAMSTYTDPEGTEWLYVGTLNATPYGSEAKVYRSPDGENWEFVTSFPGCDGVRGATEYAGLLWLGTLSSQQGCQIWVTDGTEWVKANQNGFSIGARATRGITEYRGKLYADAGQLVNGESAHIFRYEGNIEEGNLNSIDPNLWEDITPDWDNPVNSISEMVEFQGDLYVGTFDRSVVGGAFSGLGCEVWQYDGDGTGSWKRVNEPGFGNPKNGAILCMTVFKNKLYAGTQNFIIPEEGGEIGDIQELADGAEVWRTRLEEVGLRLVRWFPYFSRRALTALEWGHYLGLPSLVWKTLLGRWVLWPSHLNLWFTERLVRPLYEEPLPDEGACLFFVAAKGEDEP